MLYLDNLRGKWVVEDTSLEIGTTVLIKDDSNAPSEWILGSIMQLHSGDDNISRDL